jgi:hypothetical protein
MLRHIRPLHFPFTKMTLPFERTRALLDTSRLLTAMTVPKETPRLPKLLRGQAKLLLKHYPKPWEVELAHEALPSEFGPVPSFFRTAGTVEAPCAFDAAKDCLHPAPGYPPHAKMTIPYERTRALVRTKVFLEAIMDPSQTPRVPRWVRGKGKSLLRHYPGLWEIDRVHKANPEAFGPAPPFSRLSGTTDTQSVIDATTGMDR